MQWAARLEKTPERNLFYHYLIHLAICIENRLFLLMFITVMQNPIYSR